MIIEDAQPNDLDDVVRIHIDSFKGFFLTSLGEKFLREMYGAFLFHNTSIFKVAKHNGEIIGFAAGTLNPNQFFKDLRFKRGHILLFKMLPSVLKNPNQVIRKLIYSICYRGNPLPIFKKYALLSSIAISKKFLGGNAAQGLIKSFEESAYNLGAIGIYLTTDKHSNSRVNAFYLKNGYIVNSEFQQNRTRVMLRYTKSFYSVH